MTSKVLRLDRGRWLTWQAKDLRLAKGEISLSVIVRGPKPISTIVVNIALRLGVIEVLKNVLKSF